MQLGIDTRVTVLAAGLIFLGALCLGVWKYKQMATSETHLAIRTSTSPTGRRCCTRSRRFCSRMASGATPPTNFEHTGASNEWR